MRALLSAPRRRVLWIPLALLGAALLAGCDLTRDQVKVPNVVGKNAASAERTLEKNKLAANFQEAPIEERKCRIVKQNRRAGEEVEPFSEIRLRCEVKVPDLTGRKADEAEDKLFDAGLDSKFVNEPPDLGLGRCRVSRQGKTGSAPPGTTIRLRVACKQAPPTEPPPQPESGPSEDCDRNYRGACLDPSADDYDCEGGSGDGPEYTGRVEVVGDDPFELDSDGDGTACE